MGNEDVLKKFMIYMVSIIELYKFLINIDEFFQYIFIFYYKFFGFVFIGYICQYIKGLLNEVLKVYIKL